MNDDDAWAKVRAARVGRLATLSPSKRPHVVPFVFVLIERGGDRVAYWVVDRKPKRSPDLQRIRNIRTTPSVEFVVDAYDEDWDRLWWVRCSGTARVVEDDAERQTALDVLAAKYPQYSVDPPGGPVVAIDIGHMTGWEGISSS